MSEEHAQTREPTAPPTASDYPRPRHAHFRRRRVLWALGLETRAPSPE